MKSFTFSDSPYPVRDDLVAAYREFWRKLAIPGAWWTGAERVAIAEEVRQATQCAFCAERKDALSPYGLAGEHTSMDGSPLNARAVDAAHRVITDQTRITQSWVQENVSNGLTEGKYVELVGIALCAFSIDEFCRGLGVPLEPMPAPVEGSPSGYVPVGLETETGMVSMISAEQRGPAEQDLWPDGHDANVVRALSLVPDAVRDWVALSDAQYLLTANVGDPAANTDRILNRMQTELIAGRVSSHNECFY